MFKINITRYEDEDGNELLTTNDGSDDVVKVTGEKIKNFKRFGEIYQENPGMRSVFDSDGFNLTIKADLLGFDSVSKMENVLEAFHSQWARQNSIIFL